MKQIQKLFSILLLVVLWNSCSDDAELKNSNAAKSTGKGKVDTMSTPTLSCGDATQTSINITVTAGSSGAPAGFSLQWMLKSAFVDNGSVWPSGDSLFCKGGFSGNANLSAYNLGAGQSVSVNIGDLLFDNGASTNCPDALTCSTAYVFRAFAHATSTLYRSDFTGITECSTLPCEHVGQCTYGQGYWKNHDGWPVTSLTLGTVEYTDAEIQSILDAPASGNGLIILAHQLIAVKLNLENTADGTDIAAAVAEADALIGDLVVPPVGAGDLAPASTSELTTTLMNYNEGATGPGSCPSE